MIKMNFFICDSLNHDINRILDTMHIGPVKIHHDSSGDCFVVCSRMEWFLCVKKNTPEYTFLKILSEIESTSFRRISNSRKNLFRESDDHLFLTLKTLKTKKLGDIFSNAKNVERSSNKKPFKGYLVKNGDKHRFALMASLLLDKSVYKNFCETSKFKSEKYTYSMFCNVYDRYISC